MRLAWLVAVAGCGDHGAATADAAIDAGAACTATYRGNFDEDAASPIACASSATGSLAISAPSATLVEPLAITIELGGAAIGAYSSETVGGWDVRGTRLVTNAQCLFVAGNDVTPAGSFTLSLASVAPLHGTLDLVLTVLQTPFTNCGADLGETVEVAF